MAMLTLEEAAIRLGITQDELRAKTKSGAIRFLRDGANLLFKEEEIAKHVAPNPMVPDFTLDFDSSDQHPIADSSPLQSGSSDAHLISGSAEESSFEFSLPDDVGLVTTPTAFAPPVPVNADQDSDEFELHNPPGNPGSSDILHLNPIGDQDDSSSDFSLEVLPDSGSSSDFITSVGNEIEESLVPAEIIEDETQMGDLFELSDSGNEQTIAFTPSPDDSSSEFDLGISPLDGQADGTSSEFDLSIDPDGVAPSDSAVFETDYSGLGDADSGSEVVAIDGLDSSLEGSADGTGSEVVPIDDFADDAAATIQPGDDVEVDFPQEVGSGDYVTAEEGELEEVGDAGYTGPRSVSPAVETPWGAVPASILLITVPLLFFVALISVEMLRSVWAYNRGFAATRPLIRAVSETMTGVKLND